MGGWPRGKHTVVAIEEAADSLVGLAAEQGDGAWFECRTGGPAVEVDCDGVGCMRLAGAVELDGKAADTEGEEIEEIGKHSWFTVPCVGSGSLGDGYRHSCCGMA